MLFCKNITFQCKSFCDVRINLSHSNIILTHFYFYGSNLLPYRGARSNLSEEIPSVVHCIKAPSFEQFKQCFKNNNVNKLLIKKLKYTVNAHPLLSLFAFYLTLTLSLFHYFPSFLLSFCGFIFSVLVLKNFGRVSYQSHYFGIMTTLNVKLTNTYL